MRTPRQKEIDAPMTGHAHAYLDAVLRRASVPMEGEVFRPDWADGPRSHKVYEGLPTYPLPIPFPPDGRPGEGPHTSRISPLVTLSAMLHDSYAWRSRRLRITADPGQGGREHYEAAVWGRGSAAGGGLYPCEIYWVSGAGSTGGDGNRNGVLPGVYHYDQSAHALRRLITGDVSARVSRALGFDAQSGPDQFLLVTVRFWQNAYKYAEFNYHCVTMDLGCLLGTWQTWAAAREVPLSPAALWFDEPDLDRLLGLDPADESVLAVVPLPWSEPDGQRRVEPPGPGPQADTPVTERSRTVRYFPQAQRAHFAAVEAPLHRPTAPQLTPAGPPRPARPADAPALPLPPPAPPRRDVSASLTARRSSFGLFSAEKPLSGGELAALLETAGAVPQLRTDVRPGTPPLTEVRPRVSPGTPPLTDVAVFANHVTDVPPGVYAYDPGAHSLAPVPGPGPHPFLQEVYTLNNYNLEQAAAVLVVRARPHVVLDRTGPRGYRLLNAEVGALAQSVYLTATALGLSCGAALGFDYAMMAARLGKGPENDTWPLLLLLVGHERPNPPEFDARLT